jgi:signal transduction histidine kinase
MNKIPVLLLILISVQLYSQDRNDSILSVIESAPDTAKVRMLSELCWEYRFTDPPQALGYGLRALSLVKQLGNHQLESTLNNYLGVIQRNVGDHALALEYFYQAKHIAEEQQDQTNLGYALNNIGDIYNIESKYKQALENEEEALKIFEDLGDSVGVSYVCHQIALVHTNMYDYANALLFHRRAMKIRESLGNTAGVGYSLISMGETYLKMGKFPECYASLDSSRILFTELDDRFGLSLSMHDMGLYYKAQGDTDNAIKYFNEALSTGQDNDLPIRIRNAASELSDLYAEKSDFKKAYQMYILYKQTYDSLYQEENLVRITQLVMQNEFEQRELVQLAEIERQKQFRNYLMLSFGLVLILVIVILNRYIIKRKANINLQAKNNEIEAQRKKLEKLSNSLREKNDELSQQNEEIMVQKDHLVLLNNELEKQKSELNNTLKDLTQAQTKLVQSEKMASLGQLTAGVAHELNNPLNFISSSIAPLQRNMVDLLKLLNKYESLLDEKNLSGVVSEMKEEMDVEFVIKETTNLLKGIREGAFRSEHIVKDLRTFSRMDENEFKGVNVHEGIDSTLLLLHHKMNSRITVHKKYGDLPPLECLPGKLNQVFMNIISNSILAIQDKGDIYIETSVVENKARIAIRDTGTGMSRDTMEHIFEPFFSTRAVGKGTGLGLSISFSIIEEHHGTIEVTSEPGQGSEFVIMVPLTRQNRDI